MINFAPRLGHSLCVGRGDCVSLRWSCWLEGGSPEDLGDRTLLTCAWVFGLYHTGQRAHGDVCAGAPSLFSGIGKGFNVPPGSQDGLCVNM